MRYSFLVVAIFIQTIQVTCLAAQHPRYDEATVEHKFLEFEKRQDLESQPGHARVGNEFKKFFVDVFYRIYEYFINTAEKEVEEDKAAEEGEAQEDENKQEDELEETAEDEGESDEQDGGQISEQE